MITLDKFQDGTKVIAQFARRDNEEGTAPDYGTPQTVTLYVRRRDKDLKRGKRVEPAGTILTLTVKEFAWAEYGQSDYCPEFSEFECEGWRMKILEVLP